MTYDCYVVRKYETAVERRIVHCSASEIYTNFTEVHAFSCKF
jgi:hypothetical protein